jgi:hypothetical protein
MCKTLPTRGSTAVNKHKNSAYYSELTVYRVLLTVYCRANVLLLRTHCLCAHALQLQNVASASTALRELHAKSGLALSALAAQIGAPLSPLQRILVVALITQEVHNRSAQHCTTAGLAYCTTAATLLL